MEKRMLLAIAALAVAWVAYDLTAAGDERSDVRWRRELDGPTTRGAALDAGVGMLTPDHLLWWGSRGRPPHWTPHRVSYPNWPGYEVSRLRMGAPGACVTPAVPRAQRVWLFAPPSEVDL